MAIRHLLAWCVLALALAGGPATAMAAAKPEVGLPRTIEADVGETKGLRLMSNDRKGWHWVWLRKPRAAIAIALPLQKLPENDEAVNGLAGRTSVYITGRGRGQTSALLGYYSANGKTLFKTVVLRVTIQ
jgi:hypothetical protein